MHVCVRACVRACVCVFYVNGSISPDVILDKVYNISF